MFSSNTSQVSADANFIEDVFSTYLYTGIGANLTITNGIDLSTKGGLVWIKDRSGIGAQRLFDTARGVNNVLYANTALAQATEVNTVTAFNSSGFSLGDSGNTNANAARFVSWTFREQAKFFDVVTYSGDSVDNRAINHNLGSTPGCVIVRRLSGDDWFVYHRSLAANNGLRLNKTDAASSNTSTVKSVSSTTFTVGTDGMVNVSGSNYVAYLFAHNAGGFGLTGTDNVISCGSYTGNGSTTGPLINLGWEPQWLLVKQSSISGAGWYLIDTMRGATSSGTDAVLFANNSGAETSDSRIAINATGFQPIQAGGELNASGETCIYIAIRRGPMKTPTSGTSVFAPVALNSSPNSNVNTGFPPDWVYWNARTSTSLNVKNRVADRLRGFSGGTSNFAPSLFTNQTAAEYSNDGDADWLVQPFPNNGFRVGGPTPISTGTNIFYAVRRAPGFFDEVCYTGTGVLRTITHNLGAVPELIIIKKRSAVGSWVVYAAPVGNTKALYLNLTSATTTDTSFWNNTSPTASVFTVNVDNDTNDTNKTQVAYLFATCVGVSKVGSYVGNGSSQTIPCGFTSGSRFVMIKRTDSAGDWYVWDSARGIVAGNDPYLLLNSAAAEVTTDDSVDTDSTGFVVNQVAATNVNVTSAAYIFLAIA